jgi:hypothetical protein
MRRTPLLAFALLLAASGSLPAGEAAPPALRPGELVKLNGEKPTATVTGWVVFNWGAKLRIKIDKITEKHKHLRPGRDMDLFVRHVMVKPHKRAKKLRPTPVKEEQRLLQPLQTGDRVEFRYRPVEKRREITAYKPIAIFPREGKLVGEYVKRRKDIAILKVTEAPKGGEHLVGHRVNVSPDRIRVKGRWRTDPAKLKLVEGMQQGHRVEVGYELAGRFRLQSVKDLGVARKDPKPEPRRHKKKHKKPKGDPPMASEADPEPL